MHVLTGAERLRCLLALGSHVPLFLLQQQFDAVRLPCLAVFEQTLVRPQSAVCRRDSRLRLVQFHGQLREAVTLLQFRTDTTDNTSVDQFIGDGSKARVPTSRLRLTRLPFTSRQCTHEQDTQTLFTARRSYASGVLGVVILSVCPSVCHTRAL